MYNFDEELKRYIGEHFDGGSYEPVTGIYNRNGEAFQLFKFEQTVDFEKKHYDIILIQKHNYDVNDLECVESVDELFFKAIEL